MNNQQVNISFTCKVCANTFSGQQSKIKVCSTCYNNLSNDQIHYYKAQAKRDSLVATFTGIAIGLPMIGFALYNMPASFRETLLEVARKAF